MKYLGLPAELGRSKREVFSYLKERLWSTIKGSEKKLSMAGREVLIKSVLQSIPTYVMSCFQLPRTTIPELEKIIRQYRWSVGEGRSMPWLAWLNLCLPKSGGDIGFQDIVSFNLALLAKQAWCIKTQPHLLLSRVVKACYFPKSLLF